MKNLTGGVCAPKGFLANGVHAGIRKNKKKNDLALIFSEVKCSAASVYTTNLVKGAPLIVTKSHLINGTAQAIICNSGNANTCNSNGIEIAEETCELCADKLNIDVDDIVVASTGVIGQPLDITPIKKSMGLLIAGLNKNGSFDAVSGIMTTDTKPKQVALEFSLGGKTAKMGAIAKGSGMIHPDMATMLVFITTDAAISSAMLQKALSSDVKNTFNMVSIDGDTSTNDMVTVLANGLAGNEEITTENESYAEFMKALNSITVALCKMIAGDGEGASKTIECVVSGADSETTAKGVAKSVICSSLVKTAIFGADANWGRVLCAIGYSKQKVDINKVEVYFSSSKGEILLCKNGEGVEFSEEKAKEILLENEITIIINLYQGESSATAWGCDLTYDYVKINGDYRT